MPIATVSYNPDFLDALKALRSQKPARPPKDEIASLERRDRRADAVTILARRIENVAVSGSGVSSFDLERLLGRNDLLPVNYLQRGLLAARAVGRLWVGDLWGSNGSWGTGFLVSPRLLLTNHHVIASVEDATRTSLQLGHETDLSGRIREGKTFRLTPQDGFATDENLDFTLVAVAEISENGDAHLGDYGFLRLDPTLHKIQPDEFVTVIQHPDGQPKQIAIRENKVLKIGDEDDTFRDNFLWYASDTAPGSSGSPVFNDNWQVVAVHHKSVVESRTQEGREEIQLRSGEWIPKEEAEKLSERDIKWIANEGVRISRIFQRIGELQTEADNSAFPSIRVFLEDAKGIQVFPGTTPRESIVNLDAIAATSPQPDATLEVRVESRKKPRPRPPRSSSNGSTHPLSYYEGRKGYDREFLGKTIPLPEITAAALKFGSVATIPGTPDNVLHYTHFSLVMCETRRLAFFTAVNIDGRQWVAIERDSDEWFFDSRLPQELQLGNNFYGNEPGGNFFDRGHLVRRQDPVWGTDSEADLANSDTFHFTNCSPQYFQFNQSAELWQGLENFILTNTDRDDLLATVFTGPIFQQSDAQHRGIQVPQFFWKVVIVADGNGKLYSSAYVVSQEKFVASIPFERKPVGEFKNFQVAIAALEARTGLKFSREVRQADVYTGPPEGKKLRGLSDIQHPRR